MTTAQRRIETKSNLADVNKIWNIYLELQSSISLLDPTRSIDLIINLHNELCKLTNGTPQDVRLMMDFETHILPSCIREICDMSEKAKNFIFGIYLNH